jgi:hypothetical protein
MGTVNRLVFDNFYLPGSLLCMPPELRRTCTPNGTTTWDITYIFLWRTDFTWNQYFHRTIGTFDTLLPAAAQDGFLGTKTSPYPLAPAFDFAGLFMPLVP